MKTIAEFRTKCKTLFAARTKLPSLLRDLDKSPQTLLQLIESCEAIINLFLEHEVTKPDGILFESYLDCQDDLRICIKEFREATTRYNEKETNKKPLIPFLPLYTIRFTVPDQKSYEGHLELINRERAFETHTFTYTPYPDQLSFEIVGDVRDAKEFFENILEEKYSEYSRFVLKSPSTSHSSSTQSTVAKTTPVSSTSSTGEQSDDQQGFTL